MNILVIGATGTIGKPVVELLSKKHKILAADRNHSEYRVNLEDRNSVANLFRDIGQVDAIVCAAGAAKFAPIESLSDADFDFSLKSKLMGQVNVVRLGLEHVTDRGSITLTSGVLAGQPMKGSAAISLVNAGVEGFARAAALEAPRGIRVNVVSPGWVAETLQGMGKDPSLGIPASLVARAYERSVEGKETGAVISAANPSPPPQLL